MKTSFAERVRALQSREIWGDAALPLMTREQQLRLMDALSDAYSAGVLRGEITERRQAIRLRRYCPFECCVIADVEERRLMLFQVDGQMDGADGHT